MIDKLLEVGSSMDWITPVFALCSELFGYTKQLTVYTDAWSAVQIQFFKKGIKPRYIQILGAQVVFSVNVKQAKFAKWIIKKYT